MVVASWVVLLAIDVHGLDSAFGSRRLRVELRGD